MVGMDNLTPSETTDTTDPTDTADDDAIRRVATLIRIALAAANTAAGGDLRSAWLDVLVDISTAESYLADVPDHPDHPDHLDLGHPDQHRQLAPAQPPAAGEPGAREPGAWALAALEQAATVLDHAPNRPDHRAVMVRAALSDAIRLARGAHRPR